MEIKKKFNIRKWIIEELKKFELKYEIKTKEFMEKWTSNRIPKPENELKEIENLIKES